MNDKTRRFLTTAALLLAGYFVGKTQWPQPAYAQAGVRGAKDFAIVSGSTSATARSQYYFAVNKDGKAEIVTYGGKPVYAPGRFPAEVQLKHTLPGRLSVDHSGRISN